MVNEESTMTRDDRLINVIHFLDNDLVVDHRKPYIYKMAGKVRLVAVEPPFSLDKLLAGKRQVRKKSRFHVGLRKEGESFWIYKPFMLTSYSLGLLFPFFSWINRFMIKHMLKKITASLGMTHNLVVIISSPCLRFVVGLLSENVMCYEVYDEYAERLRLPVGIKRMFIKYEDEILHSADIVFCSSRNLTARKKQKNSNTHFIPNAADVDFFALSLDANTAIPSDLQRIPSPRIGLVGNINDIVDIMLLNFLAKSRPNWSIVCIGDVNGSKYFHKCADFMKSKQSSNIYYLGLKPYETLPSYLKGLDVCLLPYLINDYTIKVYPSKIHQYLAAGKPVVSTALPEMLCFADIVGIAYSHEDFLLYCERALSGGTVTDIERRISAARVNNIEIRIKDKIDLLQYALDAKKQ